MSELQPDDAPIENNDAPIENPDDGAELATASESEHGTKTEPVDEVESEASKQQTYINKQYGTIKQGERDLATANEELNKLRKDNIDRQAAAVKDIPPMPDPFDDDFTEKVRLRDEAIVAQANHNTTVNLNLQNQQNTQLHQQQVAQVEAAKLQDKFFTDARGVGATDEEFNGIINTLNLGGMTRQGADAIMSLGVDGYLIAKHLAVNPIEAHEFNTMNPILAGAKLVELKQKASALKPKTSNTVDPVETLQGNSVIPDDGYKNIKGAKFE